MLVNNEWKPINDMIVKFNGDIYNIYEEGGDYEGRIELRRTIFLN